MDDQERLDLAPGDEIAPLLETLGTAAVPDSLSSDVRARLRTMAGRRTLVRRSILGLAAAGLVALIAGGAVLLYLPRQPTGPGSVGGSPRASAEPSFEFTVQRPWPLPVRVFDRTGKLVAARESTEGETEGIDLSNDRTIIAGPSPNTRIVGWSGGACDASADITVGPKDGQVSVVTATLPLPTPRASAVYACPAVLVLRFVTLTFSGPLPTTTPTLAPTTTPAGTPTLTTLADSRLVEVFDQSGWLEAVADASDHVFPPGTSSDSILQGPSPQELYVRWTVCALATDIQLTVGPSVDSITIEASYPWPSDEPAPECPGVTGAVLLDFTRPVQPPK
jgi:hypothetical protein